MSGPGVLSNLANLGWVASLQNLLRRIGPFDTGIEPLGVLAEDDRVHPGFFEPAFRVPPDEVQGIPGKGAAGANTHVEVESLAHPHDGAEIGETLVTQPGAKLGLGLRLGLGGDGPEETELVPGQKVDRPLGKRVPLLDPEFPSDVPMDVLGIEPDSIQDPDRLGQNGPSDPVPGHADHRVTRHLLFPL